MPGTEADRVADAMIDAESRIHCGGRMGIATWVGFCVKWGLATFQPTQEPLFFKCFLGVCPLWRPCTRHF
jgi:hypothetical protein